MQPWTAPVPKEKPPTVTLGSTADLTGVLKRLLSSQNICSKRWIHEQYDSMVQTNTVQGPGGDAGVMRIKETQRGLAMSLDGNGRWCYLNPKLGAMHAVAEACTALGTPITGGNVSLYNETLGEGIYPTPVLGVVGIVENIERTATPHFRSPGREVILLSGATAPYDDRQLGSSEYAKEIAGALWGEPPALDLAAESALQKCVLELVEK